MDYFENIIKRLLEQQGYWARQSVKVNLTKDEKVAIGKPSIPRPELDLVGYRARNNELLVLEVKSFLDSPGVKYDELSQNYEIPSGRYKLFTSDKYRNIVFDRLIQDFVEVGLIEKDPKVLFGLAAGKIYSNDEEKISNYFDKRNWVLYRPSDIAESIKRLSKLPYENDPYVIASKIIIRNS